MAPDTPERGGGRGDGAAVHDRARVVRRYLSALDMRRPGRTVARTIEAIAHRIHRIDTELLSADPVQRLHLTQERIDLHAELLRLQAGAAGEFDDAEAAFVRVARGYSERHGITFSAWRQIGVDSAVLARAGMSPVKPPRAAKPSAGTTPGDAPAGTDDVAVPRAEGPKAPGAPAKKASTAPSGGNGAKKAAAKKSAAKKAAAKKPAGTEKVSAAKKAPATKTAPVKKGATPVQQQLPADASS